MKEKEQMNRDKNYIHKRMIAAVLVLLMVFTMLPEVAAAETVSYEGNQGTGSRVTMQDSSDIAVSDITTDTDAQDYCSNTIGTKLDAGEAIYFKAKLSDNGGQNPQETQIRENAMPHIKVYAGEDALTQETPAAAYENGEGALTLERVRYTGIAENEGAASVECSIAAGTLEKGADYALVFEKGMSVRDTGETLGKDVIFYFSTQESASGLSLNTSAISMIAGQTEKLTASSAETAVQPQWSSDKESVARVDADGTVHAVSGGTATITAEYEGETASCQVTVGAIAYGMQGTGGNQFSMLSPDDLTVLSETDEHYRNRINTSFREDSDLVFLVTMSAGMQQFDEESFVRDKLPLIKVYDAEKKQVVAQSSPEAGQAELQYGGYEAGTGITLKIAAGELESGSYCLVVGKQLAGNSPDRILGKDVEFEFKIADSQTVVEVEEVTLDWEQLTLGRGAELQLNAEVTPQDAADTSLTWSSSRKEVASVDENGKLTAVSEGTAVITATANQGGASASCEVTVVENELELSSLTLELCQNQEETLAAKADGSIVEARWQSDAPEIVSVDDSGNVKAAAAGHATLTASWEGKTAICVVNVTSYGSYNYQGIGGNTMLLKSPDNIYVKKGSTTDFNNGINTKINGSEDVVFEFTMTSGMNNFQEEAFLQNNMPHIKIYNEDKTEVVAEYDGGNGDLKLLGLNYSDVLGNHGTYVVQGIYIGVDGGVLDNGTYTLVFGKEVCGNNTNKTLGRNVNFTFDVEWSAENMEIKLPSMGASLEEAVGSRLNETQSTADIQTLAIITDGYTLTEADFSFIRETMGTSLTSLDLEQAALPENALPQGALKGCTGLKSLILPQTLTALETDSLAGCANLDSLKLTSPVPPSADASMLESTALKTVIVPSGSLQAYQAAEPWKDYLLHVAAEGVTLERERLTIPMGRSETLTAAVTPSNATNKEVEWTSSDDTVASVNANGTIQALKVGEATITARTKDGGHKAECVVTVSAPLPVVTLNLTQAEIYSQGSGSTLQLTAGVTGNDDYSEKDVYWTSSNSAIAQVDPETGLVTGKSPGLVSISAWVGSERGICVVEVKDHTLRLDKSSVSVYAAGSGSTAALRAYIDEALVAGSKVSWSSSNASVATVSSAGTVTGKRAGTAVITAQANGRTAKCTVTVKTPTIRLNKTSATIYTAGSKKVTLSATVNGVKVSGGAVSWSSSNSRVASVSRGVVTAKRKGSVTITARANGKTTSCRVNVKKPTLKLVKKSAKIRRGKKVRIRVKVTPKGKVTYKSKNRRVATVTKKGVVRGKKKGKARIQVKCNGVTRTFTVRVR